MNGKKFARDWMGKYVTAQTMSGPMTQGWVCGYTYRRNGRTEYDSEFGYYFESEGPSTCVVLLCPWPGRKTIDVQPDSLREHPVPRTVPPEHEELSRSMRECYAAEGGFRRDEKGRFTYYTAD